MSCHLVVGFGETIRIVGVASSAEALEGHCGLSGLLERPVVAHVRRESTFKVTESTGTDSLTTLTAHSLRLLFTLRLLFATALVSSSNPLVLPSAPSVTVPLAAGGVRWR